MALTALGTFASDGVAALVARAVQALDENEGVQAALQAAPAAVRESLAHVFACSDFVAHACVRDSGLLPQLLADGRLLAPGDPAAIAASAPRASGPDLAAEQQFMADLRRWRRRAIATWAAMAAILLVAFAVMFVLGATDPTDNIALSRNEVQSSASGQRIWRGTMWNHSDSLYTDLDTVVLFLDKDGKPVGQARGAADRLDPGEIFHVEAPLPAMGKTQDRATDRDLNRTACPPP